MQKTQLLRKQKLYEKLDQWTIKDIFKEFKHLLSFRGDIVSFYIYILIIQIKKSRDIRLIRNVNIHFF